MDCHLEKQNVVKENYHLHNVHCCYCFFLKQLQQQQTAVFSHAIFDKDIFPVVTQGNSLMLNMRTLTEPTLDYTNMTVYLALNLGHHYISLSMFVCASGCVYTVNKMEFGRSALLLCLSMNEHGGMESPYKKEPIHFDCFPFTSSSPQPLSHLCLCCGKVHLGLCQTYCQVHPQWTHSSVTHQTISCPLCLPHFVRETHTNIHSDN